MISLCHVLMKSTLRFPTSIMLLVFVFLSGCRLYGGYGSIEASLVQIEAANQQFADELPRRQADLQRLQQGAAANEALAPLAEAFATVIEDHTATIAEHENMLASLEDRPAYLSLGPLRIGHYRKHHRALGAVVAKQAEIADDYTNLTLEVRQAVSPNAPQRIVQARSRYQAVPLYYEQLQTRHTSLTMEQALRTDG